MQEARKKSISDTRTPLIAQAVIDSSFPLIRPGWDFNMTEGKEHLEGLLSGSVGLSQGGCMMIDLSYPSILQRQKTSLRLNDRHIGLPVMTVLSQTCAALVTGLLWLQPACQQCGAIQSPPF